MQASITQNTAPVGRLRKIITQIRQSKAPWVGLLMVLITMLVALFADYLVLHDPLAINPAAALRAPVFLEGGDWVYPLGTDRLGRDVLSRIILGTQVSLSIAIVTIVLGGALGTGLGLLAGYRGGWVDALIMRTADGFLAFPSILLALVLAVTVGPSFWVVVIVLALVLWARFARLVRGDVLALKDRDFVLLARVAGAGGFRIVFRHILPNVANTLLVLATLQVGWAIIVEASLTFLGAGVPPPTPTWGGMVAEGLDYVESAWWISTMPGLAILFVVFSYNIVGDWVRDVLDPQLRNI